MVISHAAMNDSRAKSLKKEAHYVKDRLEL